MIMPEIRVIEPGHFARAVADQLAEDITAVIAQRGSCRLAVAGGGSPRPIYEQLAKPPLSRQIEWDKVHLLWGDERCVPPDHSQSNYHMVSEVLLDRVPLPQENVHRIEAERLPAEAARRYNATLGEQPIDILLLGMGGDGHTASLFPGTRELVERDSRVIATSSPVAPYERVSLSLRAVNESHLVYLIVTGQKKAARLAEVLSQVRTGKPVLPTALVQPTAGRLVWFTDTGAARDI